MNPIRVITINAKTREALYTKIDPTLENIRSILKCDMVESQRFYDYPPTTMLLDENAGITNIEKHYFQLGHWSLINDVILVGIENGEWCDVALKLEDILPILDFLPKAKKDLQ